MRGSRPRQQRRQWQWRPGFLPAASQSRRVHVVWNRKMEKRDTGSEGSGAEPVTAYPRSPVLPLRPAVGGRILARAAIGLCRIRAVPMPRHHWPAEARRCLCCVAIGPRWSWAVPGPRQQRAAGGAGRGGLRAVSCNKLAFPGRLCGVSPRVEARGGDLRGRASYLASLLTSATGM